MSILLDALRKSERQHRKGSLPDIHAEEPLVEPSGAGSGRRWVAMVLLAVVVLVLSMYGWRAWQAHQVPTAAPEFTDEPAVSAPSRPAGTPVAPEEESAAGRSGARNAEAPAATAAEPENPGPRLSSQPRSPVETLSSDQPLQSAPRTAPPPRSQSSSQAPSAANADVATTAAADTAATQKTAAQKRREAQLAALQKAVETTGVPEEERMPPGRSARPTRGPEDDAISFWQLPEMARNSLPELRINVMVYDEEPSKRFIIMGGKRYGEGAEINSNLQLEAVQRDRALFRYGAYLFYVKQ